MSTRHRISHNTYNRTNTYKRVITRRIKDYAILYIFRDYLKEQKLYYFYYLFYFYYWY